MTAELGDLVRTRRSAGLLLDSNLLLLQLVGLTNRNRIFSFKRTQKYTLNDFDLLQVLINRFDILTDDLDLYLALLNRGAATINFNHLRSWGPSVS